MDETLSFSGKTAVYYTLGCKLNFSETSSFGKMLSKMGVRTARNGEKVDICLVNTCSVTDVAEHKCRQTIRRMAREHPGALMVIVGCYAQLRPSEVSSMDGVDLVLGSNEKARFLEFLVGAWKDKNAKDAEHDTEKSLHRYYTSRTASIRTFVPSCSRGDRTRYFLKVQDGCDYFCTYCTIPYARGFSRNAPISLLVAQAEQVAAEGGNEIVITGVNIGDYGKTTKESFLDLLHALDNVTGIKRYRISSIEPDLLTDDIIEFCSQSRAFMPHFHIPLQSGADEVLRLMHRRYDTHFFEQKIHTIKSLMPDAFIGVDVMVGCRGERPELFEECYDFLNSLDVSRLHVFPYSERPGTAALKIPYVVSPEEKKERSRRLISLSEQKRVNFYSRQIGHTAEVLLEKSKEGHSIHGFTRNYVRVELPADITDACYDNRLMEVTLGEFNIDKTALMAELI